MHLLRRYVRVFSLCTIGFITVWLAGCGALVTSSPPLQATGSTAVVKPYPTPSSTQTLYSNELTTPTAGWANGPQCVFSDGGLMVRPSGGQAYICLVPTSALTDIAVTVTVHQVSGPLTHAFGITFRHAATSKSYYFFGIDGRGRFTFTTVVNDVSHTVIPFTAKTAIHTGANATNRLQVIARGQVITLLVNGMPVGQATLSTFPSGTVGLRGINNGDVVFQHLSIAQV